MPAIRLNRPTTWALLANWAESLCFLTWPFKFFRRSYSIIGLYSSPFTSEYWTTDIYVTFMVIPRKNRRIIFILSASYLMKWRDTRADFAHKLCQIIVLAVSKENDWDNFKKFWENRDFISHEITQIIKKTGIQNMVTVSQNINLSKSTWTLSEISGFP